MNAREDFLLNRQSGIGSSDAPAVLGVSTRASPLDVYYRKTQPLGDDDPNEWQRWGKLLEPVILQHYANTHGVELKRPGQLRHRSLPWMIANLDAVRSDNVPIEAKTSRTSIGWGEPGTDQIPEDYLVQTQHQMMVLESVLEVSIRTTIVPVLIGGSDYREYVVTADDDLRGLIADAEEDFWQCVQRQTPPPPRSLADLKRLFPMHTPGKIAQANSDILLRVRELEAAQAEMKRTKKRCDALKAYIQTFMADAEALFHEGDCLATWKRSAPSMYLEAQEIRTIAPDIWARYAKPKAPARKFLLKDEPEGE